MGEQPGGEGLGGEEVEVEHAGQGDRFGAFVKEFAEDVVYFGGEGKFGCSFLHEGYSIVLSYLQFELFPF